MVQLDRKMVGRLKELFSFQVDVYKVHEVVLVVLLQLRGPGKHYGEEGMILVESTGQEEGFYIIIFRK